jgi:hypothetical protein
VGLAVLLDEISMMRSKGEAIERLELAISDAGEHAYQLNHTKRTHSIQRIEELIRQLKQTGGSELVRGPRVDTEIPTTAAWKKESSFALRSRSSDGLTEIDSAVEAYNRHVGSGDEAAFVGCAIAIFKACQKWLADKR